MRKFNNIRHFDYKEKYFMKHNFIQCFFYHLRLKDFNLGQVMGPPKGSFTLATAVCRFRSRLCQCRDRNFSISLQQCNRLPDATESNAASVNEPSLVQTNFWPSLQSNSCKFSHSRHGWMDAILRKI